jgi:uncharacterized protein (DUF885 family)
VTGPSADDQRFAALSAQWLDETMRLSPVAATQLGDHRFDAELDDMSEAGRTARLDLADRTLAALAALDRSKLDRENQVDAAILELELRGNVWSARENEEWAWNPLVYNSLAGGAIYNVMAREFAPLPARLASATARMEKVPALLAQARANLVLARVPKIHAETVAKQNPGIASVVDEMLVPHAGLLTGAERERFDKAVAGVRAAVAEHQTWIDKTLVPGAGGVERIGRDRYDRKLAFALGSSLSRDDIRVRAEAELLRVRREMYKVASDVLRDRPGAPPVPLTPTPDEQQRAIEAALELAYAERPPRDGVVEAATRSLEVASAFARDQGLFDVPADPVKIILMPEFQRGQSVAYCDSPGPLDKGQATYYAISPIPDDWTTEQVDSFLREYNGRMIHLLSIHEGVPGHYLEGAATTRHPSTLRGVLRSGVYAEGWAVYTERVMTDAGYLGGDPLFRLVQLKFYLRTIANALLDQGVHVDNWPREKAMDLMVRQTFQQEREAAGKWTRALLTSAQLPTYFVGAQEMFDLRKEVEQRDGAAFEARAFHARVLATGAPAPRYLRQLVLGLPID